MRGERTKGKRKMTGEKVGETSEERKKERRREEIKE